MHSEQQGTVDLGGAAGTGAAGTQVVGDGSLDLGREVGTPEMLEQHRHGEHRRRGVGLLPAGDVRGTAVDRLEA